MKTNINTAELNNQAAFAKKSKLSNGTNLVLTGHNIHRIIKLLSKSHETITQYGVGHEFLAQIRIKNLNTNLMIKVIECNEHMVEFQITYYF